MATARGATRKLWCAFREDDPAGGATADYVLFSTELAAMRFGVDKGYRVKAVDFGTSLAAQCNGTPVPPAAPKEPKKAEKAEQ